MHIRKVKPLLFFVVLHLLLMRCSNERDNIKQKNPLADSVKVAMYNAGRLINSEQDYIGGRIWLSKADSLASIIDDKQTRSHVLNNYGYIFEQESSYDSALTYYTRALSISESINDIKMIINRLNSIGRIHKTVGGYKTAVESYERALTIAINTNDPINIAEISNSLGNIFSRLTEPEKAINYYRNAASIWEKDSSKASSYSIALHNIGIKLHDLDSLEQALPILYQSLRIKDSLGRTRSKAYTFSALGGTYLKMDSLEKSREMYNYSFEIRKGLQDKPGIAQITYRLGKLDIVEGKLKEGMKNLTKAEELAIELRDPELLRNILEEKKKLFKTTNSLRALMETDEIFDILTDSLQRKQRLRVQEAQSKAELQREQQKTALAEKNAEIASVEAISERQKGQLRLYLVLVALLGVIIAGWQLWQIRKRNASLIALNARIKLITDNAFHSQKNALGLISALLRSKARQSAHDKELEVLRDVEGKIEALGGVAKYLFQTRLSDNTEVAASIQLASYLESLIQDTFSSVASDMAKLKTEFEDISVTSTEALNIGLIANEAITNFSKYAEAFGADQLQIETKKQEKELLLQIKDNGPGFPEGFNISNSTGFGMQMMANLVEDMEGALSMLRQEGWTFIQIKIPLKT